jgi:hypothetical protein
MAGRPPPPKRASSKVRFSDEELAEMTAEADLEDWRHGVHDRPPDSSAYDVGLQDPFDQAFETPRIPQPQQHMPSSEDSRGRRVEETARAAPYQPPPGVLDRSHNPFAPVHRNSRESPSKNRPPPPIVLDQRRWARESTTAEVSPSHHQFPPDSRNLSLQPPPRAKHKSHSKHHSLNHGPGPGYQPYPPPKQRHLRRSSDSTLCDSDWEDPKFSNQIVASPLSMTQPVPDPATWPIGPNGSPLKPALRRSTTEDHIQQDAARRAVDLVNNMRASQHRDSDGPRQRKTGVLSNLLQLYGPDAQNMNRHDSRSSLGVESVPQSRSSSVDPNVAARNQAGWWNPGEGMERVASDVSCATTINPWELDENDPRLKELHEREREKEDKEQQPPAYKSNRWSVSEESLASSAFPIPKKKKPKKGWGRRKSSVAAVVATMEGKPPEKKSEAANEKVKITSEVAGALFSSA